MAGALAARDGRRRTFYGDSVSDAPLYERDPDAWQAYLAEGNRTQPRKRVGADVLFRDAAGRMLLVDPKYKPDWDLPGGMAEANEPPLDAAIREVREELGIEWSGGRLLVIDWVAPHGPWDDSLVFVFDGGVLSAEQQAEIALQDGELTAFQFVEASEASTMLRPYMWRRVEAAVKAWFDEATVYLHDAAAIGGL